MQDILMLNPSSLCEDTVARVAQRLGEAEVCHGTRFRPHEDITS